MKYVACILVLACCLGTSATAQQKEIRDISDRLSAGLTATGKKSVAVVDFTDLQGNVTELGRFLAEEFSVSLAESSKGVEVIDRTNLKVILQENKLADTGVINLATARKIGQVAGVDSLISGTLTPFGDTVHLSIKVLDTTTARIVGATEGDIPKTKAIEELLGQGISGPGSGLHSQTSNGAPMRPKSPQASIEVMGVVATIDSCSGDGQTVVCTVRVISQQQDRQLTVGAGVWVSGRWAYTAAFDDSGVEYGSDSIVFAGKTSYPSTEINNLLVSDVPAQLVVKFNRFSSSSTKVTLLKFQAEVRPAGGGWYTSEFQLRNIPILR
jgi:TolB-like protein